MSTATLVHRKDKTSALVEVCSVRLGRHGSACRSPTFLRSSAPRGRSRFHLHLPLSAAGPLRGDVLTTVSLRQLLSLPAKEGTQDILVLESAGGCFGLLVDAVGEVLTVSASDHEPNPSILDQRRKALFAGAYKLKEKLLVMLDPERLDPMRLSQAQTG